MFLPSFSLAEAVKTLESKQKSWQALAKHLQTLRHELDRSGLARTTGTQLQPAIEALAQLHDVVETRFWEVLARITRDCRVIEPTDVIFDITAQIRDFLKLSPADSAVLATVVVLKAQGECDLFMSRDKDAFASPQTREFMENTSIVYVDNANPVVGPWRSQDPDAASRQ